MIVACAMRFLRLVGFGVWASLGPWVCLCSIEAFNSRSFVSHYSVEQHDICRSFVSEYARS